MSRMRTVFFFVLFTSVTLCRCVWCDELTETVKLLRADDRPQLMKQLALAKDNQPQLLAAIREAAPEHRDALVFLLVNMPDRDLTSLSKDFLLANLTFAIKARQQTEWGRSIPDELFLNDVLPYASANERRDDWRRDFYERFMDEVKECKTAEEAVLKLNKLAFSECKVSYHATKRPKPDQSPYESIEAGYASCTGLSILLIDACRAVGIPARMVGTPLWVNKKGNHTWVEVWDGQWRFVGACEPGPLDRTWFNGIAAQADASKPVHRIYAASFARTDLKFPLVWDRNIDYVHAVDVTADYTMRRKVTIRLLDKPNGEPATGHIQLRSGGQLVADVKLDGARELFLAGNCQYDAVIRAEQQPSPLLRTIELDDSNDQVVELAIIEPQSEGTDSR